MADFTTFTNGEPIGRGAGANAASYPAVTVFEHTFDSGERNVAAGDTCTEFIKIPAGSFVIGCMVNVLTAEATVDINVGDASDADGFAAAVDGGTTGRVVGAGAYLTGDTDATAMQAKFYAADTWVSFGIATAAATTCKFRVALVVANAG